jgi:hypothetical protein
MGSLWMPLILPLVVLQKKWVQLQNNHKLDD